MVFQLLLAISISLFGWVAWKNPLRGLVLIAAFLPCYLLRFNVFGIPSTFLEAFILVMAIVWIVKRGKIVFRWLRPSHPLRLPLGKGERSIAFIVIGMIVVAIVSVLVAPNTMSALGAFKAFIIEPIVLAVIALDLCRSKEDREQVVKGLFAGGIFVATTVIVQWVLNVGIPAPWDIERRATGIFPYPNAAGLYLAPLITMAIVRLVTHPSTSAAAFAQGVKKLLFPERSHQRTFGGVVEGLVIALGIPAILLTQTEAALVAIPAAISVTGLLLPNWHKRTIIAGAIICIAILISPLRPMVIEKLTLHDYSGEIRRTQWQETAEFLKDHPLTGAGLSGYPTAIAPYHKEPSIEIFQDPHNILLNQWVELGLLGVLLLLIAMYYGAKTWVRSIRANDVAAIAIGAALLTMIIHGLVDVPYWKNDLAAMTWILAALLLHATSSKTK